ncbi:MAG: hypothetical protein DRR16_24950 [Candidatus Parabeggiatoa sp. nov. 3]|nr:MAG: hypothetical protein DRR16_24950 [Gammaproteobacteria bacterium]
MPRKSLNTRGFVGANLGCININSFLGLFFSLFLFQMGDGGQAGGEIWVYIKFIVAKRSHPTNLG